jgi:hypothetical protein
LSPQQKRFIALLRQIEQARNKLTAWSENIGCTAKRMRR